VVDASGTSTDRISGEQAGSGKADAAHGTENGTEDVGGWEGFKDGASDQENLGPKRKKHEVDELKPTKQKKGNKEKKQKPPTKDKATSTAENRFARLESVADDEVNGGSCTFLRVAGYD